MIQQNINGTFFELDSILLFSIAEPPKVRNFRGIWMVLARPVNKRCDSERIDDQLFSIIESVVGRNDAPKLQEPVVYAGGGAQHPGAYSRYGYHFLMVWYPTTHSEQSNK